MRLTDADVEEFRRLWLRRFHEDIAPEVARQRGGQLVELYAALAQVLPSEQLQVEPNTTHSHEVLPVLPEVDRGRGPSGSLD